MQHMHMAATSFSPNSRLFSFWDVLGGATAASNPTVCFALIVGCQVIATGCIGTVMKGILSTDVISLSSVQGGDSGNADCLGSIDVLSGNLMRCPTSSLYTVCLPDVIWAW